MSAENSCLEFTSCISIDILNFEKFSDILLLKLKNNYSILWENKDFLKYVCNYFKCNRIAKKDFIKNDEFRSPQNTLLFGDDSWVTIIENKISYSFDIQKCMFSRGNITEKLRISKFDCSNQIVVDLYAGIGYFTIPLLVHSKAEHVYACEWNNDAIIALNINLTKNKVANRCTVLEGDNVQTCPKDIADRVHLGLIPSSENSWLTACAAIKKQLGGTLHIHGTIHTNYSLTNCFEEATRIQSGHKDACNMLEDCNIKIESIDSKPSYNPSSNINTYDAKYCFDKIKLDKIISSNSEQIKLMTMKRKLKPSWVDWSCYVCYRLKEIFMNLYGRDWHVKLMHIECVKSYAPHISHLVLDINCKPDLTN